MIATRVGAITGSNLQEAVCDRYGRVPPLVLRLSIVGVKIRTVAVPGRRYAGEVFGVGLLGSALIAVPALTATTGDTVDSEFDLPRGLSEPVRTAPAFHGVIGASTVVAVLISLSGIPTIRLLFLASIVAGVALGQQVTGGGG